MKEYFRQERPSADRQSVSTIIFGAEDLKSIRENISN